ncbi:MAG: GLPGLI family protein [Cyclobacteriaceae bacterium]|jgi:GLPGLI family protein|nr:GLPGLI family protein [Cyclobacteriaceae bacterium]
MKRLLLIVGILVSVAAVRAVWAQAKDQGVITYEVKMNLHRNLPPGNEQMKAMIPEYRTSHVQVFFAGASITKPLIEDEEDQDINANNGAVATFRFSPPTIETYFEPSTQIITTAQEFMGKQYLIEDTLKTDPWKFGTETKNILGYECRQAHYTDATHPERKREITAWFTDQIRPHLGPERFLSLPGTVLAIDVNNGERVLVARDIRFRELKKNELKKPATGTRISRQEFQKIMDEFRKQNGGRGFMIRN